MVRKGQYQWTDCYYLRCYLFMTHEKLRCCNDGFGSSNYTKFLWHCTISRDIPLRTFMFLYSILLYLYVSHTIAQLLFLNVCSTSSLLHILHVTFFLAHRSGYGGWHLHRLCCHLLGSTLYVRYCHTLEALFFSRFYVSKISS